MIKYWFLFNELWTCCFFYNTFFSSKYSNVIIPRVTVHCLFVMTVNLAFSRKKKKKILSFLSFIPLIQQLYIGYSLIDPIQVAECALITSNQAPLLCCHCHAPSIWLWTVKITSFTLQKQRNMGIRSENVSSVPYRWNVSINWKKKILLHMNGWCPFTGARQMHFEQTALFVCIDV